MLDGIEWSALRSNRFTLAQNDSGVHLIEGREGSRASLDIVVKTKVLTVGNEQRSSGP